MVSRRVALASGSHFTALLIGPIRIVRAVGIQRDFNNRLYHRPSPITHLGSCVCSLESHYTMGLFTPLQRCSRLLLVAIVALALTGDGSNCFVQALTFAATSASTTRSPHHSFGCYGGSSSVNVSVNSKSSTRFSSNSNSRSWTTALSAANSPEEDLEMTRQIIFQHQSQADEKEIKKKKEGVVRRFFSFCTSPYRRFKSYLHLKVCVPKKPKTTN
jgi:hypothetical protein